jgi:hypothetical protein
VSSDHFSVDGTLIEAWASMKSFKPKDAASPDDTPPPDSGRNPRSISRARRARRIPVVMTRALSAWFVSRES